MNMCVLVRVSIAVLKNMTIINSEKKGFISAFGSHGKSRKELKQSSNLKAGAYR